MVTKEEINLISQEELAELLSSSRTTIHRQSKNDEEFPPKIQVSPGRVAYRAKDVKEYLEEKEIRNN